jgi:HD domain
VSDTRALLNRISEFRQRLEAMPRLIPEAIRVVVPPKPVANTPVEQQIHDRVEAGSRTQQMLEASLRQLAGTQDTPAIEGHALTHRARRLLNEAQGLVSRLRIIADDPLLAGPAPDAEGSAELDPVAMHYRDTASLVEAAVRYAGTFPDNAAEQMRLSDGLEVMLDAARRRLALLANAVELRRADATHLDVLSRFLVSLADQPSVEPMPLVELANAMLADEPSRPLRFLAVSPLATQAYLGGPGYREPSRFIAAQAINRAKVVVRLVKADAEWRHDPLPPVLAAFLLDAGMMTVDPATLAHPGPLGDSAKRAIEAHCRIGAEWVLKKMPKFAGLADAIAAHHERLDGTGYPMGLRGPQLSAMTRLMSAVDTYTAMCTSRTHRLPFDSRTALTDVLLLADRGQLDRYAAEKLLTLGFHPVGTVVELVDGSTAVVVTPRDPRLNLGLVAKPVVAVLIDDEGRTLPNPRYIDLAESPANAVVRALPPDERRRKLSRHYPEWN